MLPKLTKSGIVVVSVGAIIFVVGLILFLSVFFWAASEMNSPMHSGPFQPNFRGTAPFDRPLPFQNAIVGVVLVGIGGFMVKVGLGFTLVGSSGKIASWFHDLSAGGTHQVYCPECNRRQSLDAKFCSDCGTQLKD